MKKHRRPRAHPLRCPKCHEEKALAVHKLPGTRGGRSTQTALISCRACAYLWWSTHRDLGAIVMRFLEHHGQTRLFPLDTTNAHPL